MPAANQYDPVAPPGMLPYIPAGHVEYAIRYRQGSRTMYVMVPNPWKVVEMTKDRRDYDPRHETKDFSNRLKNRPHIAAIAEYLAVEPAWILGAMVVYVQPETLTFHAYSPDRPDEKAIGILDIPEGAPFFFIGDGQHRGEGYGLYFQRHRGAPEMLDRLMDSGQPVIIVEESSPAKASLDFVDLATTKPIPSSLRAALDKRYAVNRLSLDLALDLPFLDNGQRIEFLRASVTRKSSAIFAFASWKFAVATLIIGFGSRSGASTNKACEAALSGDQYDHWKKTLQDIFEAASDHIPGWREIADGTMSVSEARDKYVSCTSAGLTAFSGATYQVLDNAQDVGDAIRSFGRVDWRKANFIRGDADQRVNDVFFEGSILQEGRTVSNRPSFEAAASALYDAFLSA